MVDVEERASRKRRNHLFCFCMMHSLRLETQKNTVLSSAPASQYTTGNSLFTTNFVTAGYAGEPIESWSEPTLKECITWIMIKPRPRVRLVLTAKTSMTVAYAKSCCALQYDLSCAPRPRGGAEDRSRENARGGSSRMSSDREPCHPVRDDRDGVGGRSSQDGYPGTLYGSPRRGKWSTSPASTCPWKPSTCAS